MSGYLLFGIGICQFRTNWQIGHEYNIFEPVTVAILYYENDFSKKKKIRDFFKQVFTDVKNLLIAFFFF